MSTAPTTPAATTGPEARERPGHGDGGRGRADGSAPGCWTGPALGRWWAWPRPLSSCCCGGR